MKAEETQLLNFLRKPMQLSIPFYQRTYNWKKKECEQLWNDIISVGEDDSIPGHFIGSIVYVEKGLFQVAALPKLLVIDGQQRLTTLSLLILALSNYIKEENITSDLKPEKLTNYYLLNIEEEDELKYKLVLTKSDKDSLIKILDGMKLTDNDSTRIIENYNYFSEKIEQTDINIIYKGLEKLIIIDVSLDRDKDNPQLIFESMNSTGLELTQADLIRNYILMGLDIAKQKEIYENYWFPIENNFGHSAKSGLFDWFIRDFLTVKIGRIPTTREIYLEFKKYSSNKDIKEIVKEIHKFSIYYANIALEKEPDKVIRKIFSDINELRVDVAYPFILHLYHDYINRKLDKDAFIEILHLIESYVFRRAICGVPTNSLNKTFASLYRNIDHKNYLDSLKITLVQHDSYRRMPNDEEFKRELLIKDVYNFRSRNYLLRKLENHNRKEFVDVESYTIEHIIPQNPNLSNEWKKELGEKWEEIQDMYLHTIGNLTLTGYNSELSDNSFKTKRDMKGGFKDSPIRLNSPLAKLDTWNEKQIKNRAKKLADLAQKIWLFPDVDKEVLDNIKSKEEDIVKQKYALDDHNHLNQKSPMRPLFDKLRKKILNIDPSVKEEFTKQYVAYKSTTNFVDIIPQKKALCLSLNIDFDEIKDVQGKCRDVSNIGRWGNGKTEVKIESEEEIDYGMGLIKQAFDNITEI